jgi:hypothetical protein
MTQESTPAPETTRTLEPLGFPCVNKMWNWDYRGPLYRTPDPEDFPFRMIGSMRDERYR